MATQKNMKARKILLASLLLLVCISLGYATYQQKKVWVVPEDVKKLKNHLQPTLSNLSAAAQLFNDDCAECHGDHGKGDGPEAMMHEPPPADLTDLQHMRTVTDGAIYYQITEGRKPMPSFKNRLTEDQRWQLVLLVRSFSKPPAAPENKPTPTPSSSPEPANKPTPTPSSSPEPANKHAQSSRK
jgi:mono/diheme cytochrome c family protein